MVEVFTETRLVLDSGTFTQQRGAIFREETQHTGNWLRWFSHDLYFQTDEANYLSEKLPTRICFELRRKTSCKKKFWNKKIFSCDLYFLEETRNGRERLLRRHFQFWIWWLLHSKERGPKVANDKRYHQTQVRIKIERYNKTMQR